MKNWLKSQLKFTTKGFLLNAWIVLWGSYILCDAGINIYQSTYDSEAWLFLAMWKILFMLYWWASIKILKMDKDLKGSYRTLIDLQEEHIRDLHDMIALKDQKIALLESSK